MQLRAVGFATIAAAVATIAWLIPERFTALGAAAVIGVNALGAVLGLLLTRPSEQRPTSTTIRAISVVVLLILANAIFLVVLIYVAARSD